MIKVRHIGMQLNNKGDSMKNIKSCLVSFILGGIIFSSVTFAVTQINAEKAFL